MFITNNYNETFISSGLPRSIATCKNYNTLGYIKPPYCSNGTNSSSFPNRTEETTSDKNKRERFELEHREQKLQNDKNILNLQKQQLNNKLSKLDQKTSQYDKTLNEYNDDLKDYQKAPKGLGTGICKDKEGNWGIMTLEDPNGCQITSNSLYDSIGDGEDEEYDNIYVKTLNNKYYNSVDDANKACIAGGYTKLCSKNEIMASDKNVCLNGWVRNSQDRGSWNNKENDDNNDEDKIDSRYLKEQIQYIKSESDCPDYSKYIGNNELNLDGGSPDYFLIKELATPDQCKHLKKGDILVNKGIANDSSRNIYAGGFYFINGNTINNRN